MIAPVSAAGPAHPVFTGRRVLFATLVGLSTIGAMALLFGAFADGGLSPLEALLLLLYAVLFAWICVSFWTATIGFAILLARQWRPTGPAPEPPPARGRVALLMPVYNEDPLRVFAGLRAIWQSVAATAAAPRFDLFILSDTRDADAWVEEEKHWQRLCTELDASGRIFYRNRVENTERKSGNIADWVHRCGGAYEYMIILDADSIMAGETLALMVQRMDADPRLGLLQVPPVPVNHDSLFARILQFAGSLYGRMYTAGLDFWQATQGNYWGHNAIVRVRAFAACCGLPHLPGREPLGGEILSHDFVEAALLVRAGWQVKLAWDLEGSYEELPTTLIDYAKRDRRWCQGNLQHARMVLAHGWHPVTRAHFAMGVMSYLASPLWVFFLAIAGVEAYIRSRQEVVYFFGQNLFPTWPISYRFEMATVLLVTLAMLFLPKLMALVLLAFDHRRLRLYGGLVPATASALLESLFATLLAPVLAMFQTKFVFAILMRRTIGWPAQQRGDHATGLSEALSAHAEHVVAGVVTGLLTWFYVPGFFWWFTPVLAGLLLAVPMSMLTSRSSIGRAARGLRLFMIPEETDRPDVLQRLDRHLEALEANAAPAAMPPWRQAVVDPAIHALHMSMLGAEPLSRRRRHYLRGLALHYIDDGPDTLKPAERRELISSRGPLADLHAYAWAHLEEDSPGSRRR
ncbi:MAG: glucans biosynthesis glucosyltransferase MdoH [Gammaproteobacteria bacterium]